MPRKPFESKDPEEIRTYGCDFSASLAEGETIVAPTVTVTVADGSEAHADPDDMKDGAATIDGAVILQKLRGGAAGNSYAIRFEAVTSAGHCFVEVGFLPVRGA